MGLTEWTVGLGVFQILMVILLIGIGGEFKQSAVDTGTATLLSDTIKNQTLDDFNLITVVGDFVGIVENFFFAVGGLPWWVDFLMFMPLFILIVIVFMYARGVS